MTTTEPEPRSAQADADAGARWLGYTQLAHALSTPERPVSRQQVRMWHTRRARNGMPAPQRRDGRWTWDVDAVRAWYAEYVPSPGGRPRRSA